MLKAFWLKGIGLSASTVGPNLPDQAAAGAAAPNTRAIGSDGRLASHDKVCRALPRILAGCFLIGILWAVVAYPIAPWFIGLGLVAYTAILWRRPSVFMLVIPVVLPAWDLGLWTGWTMVGEADLFILTTVAVLLLKAPPRGIDLLPRGLPRAVVLAVAASWLLSTIIGLSSSLGAPHSDNEFLRPDNALRLSKSLLEALLLLPFLRQRQRTHGDTARRLGWGLTAGLGAVTVIVLAERMLFAGILDFSSAYRVAGPFSSMRVGGGHIGAYAALALPFALCLFQLQRRRLAISLSAIAAIAGGYTIAVTFARAAYAAAMVAILVACLGWVIASQSTVGAPGEEATVPRARRSAAIGIMPVVLVLLALGAAASLTGMQERFAASAMDFLTRQNNWRAGLAVRDRDAASNLFGLGLGTYQRAMLMRSTINRPSDLVLAQDDAGTFVSLRIETPFFLGQKIASPAGGTLHLSLRARSPHAGTTFGAVICDKVLLYSENCRGSDVQLTDAAHWTLVEATIPIDGLGGGAVGGLLRRPVEFSLYGSVGQRIEIRDIALSDTTGRSVLGNAGFEHGLDRWIFTDDSHVSWRMLNQYLMLFFETGAAGLAAFVALCGLGLAGGIRAVRSGDTSGAAVAAAIAGFLVSCLFDNVMEAPRVATLLFLVCWCGLLQWERRNSVARSAHS